MEYAYKKTGFTGKVTYEPSSDGGPYVILEKDEYSKLSHNCDVYERWYESEKKSHQQDLDKAKRDMEKYRIDCDEHAEAVISAEVSAAKKAAGEKVAAIEDELKKQSGLNQSLLRIMKERANAKRGLQPKKKRSGYRFAGKIMQTKTISGHDKKTGALYTDVWMTTLETPYDAGLPFDQIEGRIFADLMGNSGILLGSLKVTYWTVQVDDRKPWKGPYMAVADDIKKGKNYLFDFKFMANPRSGLWEIQITTTGPVFMNPELM